MGVFSMRNLASQPMLPLYHLPNVWSGSFRKSDWNSDVFAAFGGVGLLSNCCCQVGQPPTSYVSHVSPENAWTVFRKYLHCYYLYRSYRPSSAKHL